MSIQTVDRAIAIDMSTSLHDIRVLCPHCAGGSDRRLGSPLYAGDEWGDWEDPECSRCGQTIRGLHLVDPGQH